MIFSLHGYFLPALWGLLLLASWIGWGHLLRRMLRVPAGVADWALVACWGIALTLAIAGVLMVFGLASERVLFVVALLGMVLFLVECGLHFAGTPERRKPTEPASARHTCMPTGGTIPASRRTSFPGVPRPLAAFAGHIVYRQEKFRGLAHATGSVLPIGARVNFRRLLPLLPAVCLLAFYYATSVQTHTADPWDDWSAYLPLAKRLAQTGTLLDPFSVRRLLTFGGQQVLDVQLLAGGSFLNVDILEQGLAKILFAGLLWNLFKRSLHMATASRRWLAGMLLFIFLLIPVPHVNVNSQMTGAVLFLALLCTFDLRVLEAIPLRRALLVGMVGAAFATMRTNYVPTAALAVALAFGGRFLAAREGKQNVVRELTACLFFFAMLLIPWSVVLHQSSGTFLYPPFRGTQRPEYDYLSAGLSPIQSCTWLAGFLILPRVLALLLPVSLAFAPRLRRQELPFFLAALAATCATALTFTLTDYSTLYRLVFPALFAVAIAVLGRSLLNARKSIALVLPGALLLFLIAVDIFRPRYDAAGNYDQYSFLAMVGDDWNAWRDPKSNPYYAAAALAGDYRHAQEAVPAGEKIFVAATYPALLDFSRNPVFPIDMVGGASPPPGMPLRAGPAAVKAYLLNQGIEYLMFTDPGVDSAHLSREAWQRAENAATATPAFRRVAPFNLAAIEDFESLARTQRIIYQDRTLRVVALR